MRTRNWDTARAECLRTEGKNNMEIADMVGSTPAAVGLYFRSKRGASAPESAKTVTSAPVAKQPEASPEKAISRAPQKDSVVSASTKFTGELPTFGVDVATLAGILQLVASVNPEATVTVDGRVVSAVQVAALPGMGKRGGIEVQLVVRGG